jgi:L-aspartate oxidase
MVHDRFPLISAACASAGLDLACDRIPVSPAAHYLMGGVETDLDGRTSVPDLYAAGEVACTGVHGANRLASNSLLEGLVFGRRAGAAMHADRAVRAWPAAFTTTLDVGPSRAVGDGADDEIQPEEASVRARMWQHAGVVRHREGLDAAVSQLDRAWRSGRTLPERLSRARRLSVAAARGRSASGGWSAGARLTGRPGRSRRSQSLSPELRWGATERWELPCPPERSTQSAVACSP